MTNTNRANTLNMMLRDAKNHSFQAVIVGDAVMIEIPTTFGAREQVCPSCGEGHAHGADVIGQTCISCDDDLPVLPVDDNGNQHGNTYEIAHTPLQLRLAMGYCCMSC